ncbi:hypothetical protein RZS08_48895, partial [Arthrospira platensis SPKY1]|nr:hypothetical protein [Arthrospira platensis SPKY1]
VAGGAGGGPPQIVRAERAVGQGQNRRIVERPLHFIARPDQNPGLRRFARRRPRRLAWLQRDLTPVVGGGHHPFEHGDGGRRVVHAHQEFGAFDGTIQVGRIDRERFRFAAE